MKLSAGIAVFGIVLCGWGACMPAAAQEFAAPGADRYGSASPYENVVQPSASAATGGALPAYANVIRATGPTAMAPNPLRPNSTAAAALVNVAATSDPLDARGAGIPALHFDGRVEPAAASAPAEVSPELPTDLADDAAAIAGPMASEVDPASPAAAGLDFTLPPSAPVAMPVAEPTGPVVEDAPAPDAMAAGPPVEIAAAPAAQDAPPPMSPASASSPYGGSFALDPTAYGEPESRRLAPANEESEGEARSPGRTGLLPVSFSQLDGLSTAGAGLAIAVGLFLVCTWMVRRTGPKPTSLLPSEAFSVMGRAPLSAKSFAQLLRVGNKLVLVAVSAEGTQPLTEVTDPDEVDRLVGLCQGSRPGGHSAEFQQVLAQLSKEPARGFLGREGSSARRRAV